MPIDYTKRPSDPGSPSDGGVSLRKVVLTKSAPTVSLTKQGGPSAGQLRVNLNWTARPAGSGGGFFKKAPLAIDLDLACLWELTDGRKGVVQALGNSFSVDGGAGRPVIRLDGDDRTGSSEGGENLFVDLGQLTLIKRILVFTFIYEGATNWAAANAVVTLFPATGPEVEVHLDESDPQARSCAIALLENRNGELTVTRQVQYLRGIQAALDQAYGWGLKWAPGRK